MTQDVQNDIDPYYDEKYLQKYFHKIGIKVIVHYKIGVKSIQVIKRVGY
jgi:hypothetical protein